jgi:hypothetical protein
VKVNEKEERRGSSKRVRRRIEDSDKGDEEGTSRQ